MKNHEQEDTSRNLSLFVYYSRKFTTVLGIISGVGLALLAVPTVVDVFYRKAFGPSIPGVVEVSEITLVLTIILGMAVALRDGDHIATPVFTSRLKKRSAAMVEALGLVVMAVLLSFIFFGSFENAYRSFLIREYRMGFIEVPIWPAKAAIPIGILALLMEVLVQIIDKIEIIFGRPLVSVKEK
jgi:TRAP-type C4-dicarboxylate transport system permease small subunit